MNQSSAVLITFWQVWHFPTKFNQVSGEKPYQFAIEPGYGVIYMDLQGSGFDQILEYPFVNFKNTLTMGPRWLSSLELLLSYDVSKISSLTGDDDNSALKAQITWNNIIIADREQGQIIIPEIRFTQNAARGKNFKYTRIDLSTT